MTNCIPFRVLSFQTCYFNNIFEQTIIKRNDLEFLLN